MAESGMLEYHHLQAQVCREHFERTTNQFERLGLGRGQFGVLSQLWKRDGLTQTELCEAMHVQPATISNMLQRMENAGFVERHPDDEDQRATRVYLTQAGRDVRPEIEAIVESVSCEALAGLSPAERLLLRRMMIQMRDNLRRANNR